MSIRNLFFAENSHEGTGIKKFRKTKEEGEEKLNSYSTMLGLNKNLKFTLPKDEVTDSGIFNAVVAKALSLLKQDLERFGYGFYEIEPKLRNMLMGNIGSMTLIVGEGCHVEARFHLRDADGIWDEKDKTFPESETESEHKYEVFFPLEK